jgi:hypothetical protein
MLKRWLIILVLSAGGLVVASCADPGSSAVATAAAARLAAIAATQLYVAATQVAAQVATDVKQTVNATTQKISALENGQPVAFNDPRYRNLGKDNHPIIIDEKEYVVIFTRDMEVVWPKPGYADYTKTEANRVQFGQ